MDVLGKHALIPEVSLAEAARILGIDPRTVKGLIQQGLLRARLAGLPTSKRPRYRIPEQDVLTLRNSYQRQTIDWKQLTTSKGTPKNPVGALPHIRHKPKT